MQATDQASKDVVILVISSQAQLRLTLQQFLQSRGFQPCMASHGREAMEIDAGRLADLVIIVSPLPDLKAVDLLAALRKQRVLMRDIVDSQPLAAILVDQRDDPSRASTRHLGVVATLRKPINLEALDHCVQGILKGELSVNEERLTHLCILDPEMRALQLFSRLLQDDLTRVHQVRDVFEMAEVFSTITLHVLLMEIIGLSEEPVECVRQLKQQHPELCIIICTALHDVALHAALRDAGASEVLTKPVNLDQMREVVRHYLVSSHEPTPV